MKTKIVKPAIKAPSGKVIPGEPGKQHKDIPHSKGKHVFKTSAGKTVDRKEGAKIAKAAGQANVKSLHSHNLPEYKAKHK